MFVVSWSSILFSRTYVRDNAGSSSTGTGRGSNCFAIASSHCAKSGMPRFTDSLHYQLRAPTSTSTSQSNKLDELPEPCLDQLLPPSTLLPFNATLYFTYFPPKNVSFARSLGAFLLSKEKHQGKDLQTYLDALNATRGDFCISQLLLGCIGI